MTKVKEFMVKTTNPWSSLCPWDPGLFVGCLQLTLHIVDTIHEVDMRNCLPTYNNCDMFQRGL